MFGMTQVLEQSFATDREESDWWDENGGFFGRHYMEGDDSREGYLSTPLTLDERTEREVRGIVELLDLRKGQRVLDCPCGYGRHTLRLAARGYRAVGVDINGEELAIARKHGRHLSNLELIKSDMRHLPFEREFDAVVNMFYSFGFFRTDEENIDALRRFRQALRPGGKLLMHTDVNIPRILDGTYKLSEQRSLRSGKRLEIHECYDPIHKRIRGTWTIVGPDDHAHALTPYSMRVYTFEEFAQWCRSVGFTRVTGYGDWERAPLAPDSEDMIVVAEV